MMSYFVVMFERRIEEEDVQRKELIFFPQVAKSGAYTF